MEEVNMVDWDVVEEELGRIDDAWKQAKFDSLPHVVNVLTSPEPDAMLHDLSQQRDTVEDLVDDVVLRYHNGFNKAIHNYSQILRLFSESAASMSGLKSSLAESRKLLSTRHKQLQQLWYRSITLRHVLSLLDQIDSVSKVPARIEKLMGERKLFAAVQLHMQSVTMLEREGIQGVGGLRDVRAELSKLRGVLFSKVVEDLHLHLYNKGDYSINLSDLGEKEEDITIAIGPPPAGSNPSPAVRGRSLRTLRQNTRPRTRLGLAERESGDGDDDPGRHGAQGMPIWLAEATPNDFTENMLKIDAPPNVKYLMTMVECLAMLSKLPAGGAIIFQRLRPTVRELIAAEVKARAASVEASRPRVDQVRTMGVTIPPPFKSVVLGVPGSAAATRGQSVPGGGKGAAPNGTKAVGIRWAGLGVVGPPGPLMGLGGSAQIAAQELMDSVLQLCNRLLENHVVVGETMEAKAAVSEHGSGASPRRTSIANGSDLDGKGEIDLHQSTGGYSVHTAWSILQSECQQLVCDILRATPEAAAGDTNLTLRLNATKTTGDRDSNDEQEVGGLSFAFRFVDLNAALPGGNEGASGMTGEALRHGRPRRGSTAQAEAYGTAAALPERGLYLTSALYRPIVQFTDKVTSLMTEGYVQKEGEGLRGFMENFVKDQFLPRVCMDYRTAISDVLSSPAAFRPKARTIGSWDPKVEKGRPILQGLLYSEQLIQEVLGWAQAMPLFAAELVDLVQALLERVLERCKAAHTQIVVGSLASNVGTRTDIEELLREEPAHRLLDSIAVGEMQLDNPFLGTDREEEETGGEAELWRQLLALQPVREETLITETNKLVVLTALSDSLDYIADSISQLGNTNLPLTSPSGRAGRASGHKRQVSTLTSSLGALMEKYRSLSTECLKSLRIEILLHTVCYLQPMAERVYVSDTDAEEPEEFIVALTSQLSRYDEEMAAYVPPIKRVYIFSGVTSLAAQSIVGALASMKAINLLGVRQVTRNCIALQQTLVTLGGSSSTAAGVQRRLDRVRTYYELLSLPIEALLAFVSEHPFLFSFPEYSALLRVNVTGRQVPQEAIIRMGRTLESFRLGGRAGY